MQGVSGLFPSAPMAHRLLAGAMTRTSSSGMLHPTSRLHHYQGTLAPFGQSASTILATCWSVGAMTSTSTFGMQRRVNVYKHSANHFVSEPWPPARIGTN